MQLPNYLKGEDVSDKNEDAPIIDTSESDKTEE